VKFFVPKNVHETLPVLYMAPSTEWVTFIGHIDTPVMLINRSTSSPLDGLNKPYGRASVRYYRQYYNELSSQQCGVKMNWDRGYICQIARFDPSKGARSTRLPTLGMGQLTSHNSQVLIYCSKRISSSGRCSRRLTVLLWITDLSSSSWVTARSMIRMAR
jgi:hypothetical protein